MNLGKLVFAQVPQPLPLTTFRRCAARYGGEPQVQSFSCLDPYLRMAFAPRTYRESRRDIEACLRAPESKLYHWGMPGGVSRSTLADANEVRDWRIYADFAPSRIRIARRWYADEPLGVDLQETVSALDARTIDLCLAVFSGAPFRAAPAAIQRHTLGDLRGNLPGFLPSSDGQLHDVKVLDLLPPEPGAFYILERGSIDLERLPRLHPAGSFFVTRAQSHLKAPRRYAHPLDRNTGWTCDPSIVPTGCYTRPDFDAPWRRIRFQDPQTGKRRVLLTHNFTLAASTITALYRCRWPVEWFFQGIQRHLRIQVFCGTSENAVKTPVWIAVSTYRLVAIVKKRLHIPARLYAMLQILSVTLFERIPWDPLLNNIATHPDQRFLTHQLNRFN